MKFGSTPEWPAYLKVFTITNYISQSNEKVTLQQKRANHIEANKTRKEALGFQTNQCNLEIGKSWSQTEWEHFRKKRGTRSLQRHEIAHKAVEWKLTRNSVSHRFVCLFLLLTIRSKAEKSFFAFCVRQSSVRRRPKVKRTYAFTSPAVLLSQ